MAHENVKVAWRWCEGSGRRAAARTTLQDDQPAGQSGDVDRAKRTFLPVAANQAKRTSLIVDLLGDVVVLQTTALHAVLVKGQDAVLEAN